MSDNSPHEDAIAQIIAKVREEAYAEGVRDTIAKFSAAAHTLIAEPGKFEMNGQSAGLLKKPASPVDRLVASRGRPSKALGLVQSTISISPGLSGVDVINAVQREDETIRRQPCAAACAAYIGGRKFGSGVVVGIRRSRTNRNKECRLTRLRRGSPRDDAKCDCTFQISSGGHPAIPDSGPEKE